MEIIKALKNFSKSNYLFFTTPGHSQGIGVSKEVLNLIGKKAFNADFSEVDGLDNLQNPEGIILDSQKKASEIYGSKASFYLVNGSSSGILALMFATVKKDEKVLIARNAHKSVINALTLAGAKPIWVNTEWSDFWNIPTNVSLEKIKQKVTENPDIKAFWMTNPTYEGVTIDITEISKFCKEKNILLIVDEAHGALWQFNPNLPTPSILCGADASVQSLHKTAGSLNQSAILHISHHSDIEPIKIQRALNIINTTSPSYLLLASVEGAINYLNSSTGKHFIQKLLNNIDNFKNNLLKNIEIQFLEESKNYKIDKTKLLISMYGVSGFDLANELYAKHKIETEFDNYRSILALTGIGTTKDKLNKFERAIIKTKISLKNSGLQNGKVTPFICPETILTPQEAYCSNGKIIDKNESIGLISKETITAYPPGIPILIAGEKIQESHLEFLKNQVSVVI